MTGAHGAGPPRTAVLGPGAAAATSVGGRHRRGSRLRVGSLLGLVVALVASTVLILTTTSQRPPAGAETTLARAWPDAKTVDVPGFAPDGPAYSPIFFLDAGTSVGTAASPDGRHIRLLLRGGDGPPRELRRLAYGDSPQFGAFVVSGDTVAWAESTAGADGRGVTRMWAADWRSGTAPRAVTADTGDVAFFNSEYDLVIADGRLHWVAVAPGEKPTTELRSVALTGGPTATREIAGAWALTSWPWAVSAGIGQGGPIQLLNLSSAEVVTVDGPQTELVTCGVRWCRVLVLAGDGGPSRTDLMRTDGTDRRRIADATTTAAVIDVAVLDRFEVLTRPGSAGTPTSSQELLLYDVTRRRTVVVATAVGMVLCRGGFLWWSTGDEAALVWHALDLRKLERG